MITAAGMRDRIREAEARDPTPLLRNRSRTESRPRRGIAATFPSRALYRANAPGTPQTPADAGSAQSSVWRGRRRRRDTSPFGSGATDKHVGPGRSSLVRAGRRCGMLPPAISVVSDRHWPIEGSAEHELKSLDWDPTWHPCRSSPDVARADRGRALSIDQGPFDRASRRLDSPDPGKRSAAARSGASRRPILVESMPSSSPRPSMS